METGVKERQKRKYAVNRRARTHTRDDNCAVDCILLHTYVVHSLSTKRIRFPPQNDTPIHRLQSTLLCLSVYRVSGTYNFRLVKRSYWVTENGGDGKSLYVYVVLFVVCLLFSFFASLLFVPFILSHISTEKPSSYLPKLLDCVS